MLCPFQRKFNYKETNQFCHRFTRPGSDQEIQGQTHVYKRDFDNYLLISMNLQ